MKTGKVGRELFLKHGRSFIAISSPMNGSQFEVLRMSLFLLKFGANVRLSLSLEQRCAEGEHFSH